MKREEAEIASEKIVREMEEIANALRVDGWDVDMDDEMHEYIYCNYGFNLAIVIAPYSQGYELAHVGWDRTHAVSHEEEIGTIRDSRYVAGCVMAVLNEITRELDAREQEFSDSAIGVPTGRVFFIKEGEEKIHKAIPEGDDPADYDSWTEFYDRENQEAWYVSDHEDVTLDAKEFNLEDK